MSDSIVAPSGPWDPGRQAFSMDKVQPGRSNLSGWRGAIDTEHQKLSGALRLTGYKLKSQNDKADFYSIFGSLTHGVSHAGGAYNPATNWVSVGYYATRMSLSIELQNDSPGCEIWDSGPTSTVGSDTTGFNIGGSLSGGTFAGEPVLSAGVSGSFSASYSSPSVTFASAQVGDVVRWDVSMPGVGYISPANPANPREPSYAGYKWYYGVIYAVPKGHGFSIAVSPTIVWEFDYTRGISNNTKTWADTQTFDFVEATQAAEAVV